MPDINAYTVTTTSEQMSRERNAAVAAEPFPGVFISIAFRSPDGVKRPRGTNGWRANARQDIIYNRRRIARPFVEKKIIWATRLKISEHRLFPEKITVPAIQNVKGPTILIAIFGQKHSVMSNRVDLFQ